MKQKTLMWIVGYFTIIFIVLALIAIATIELDPYFHYGKPKTDQYFYTLNNQRSQNNGIIKHFSYSGLITGTSMTENFKTSEAEELWGSSFIKVSFSGATFKEINDNIEIAIQNNPNLNIVIRGLDMAMFMDDKNKMRTDLGEYPTYLYDNDIFNDVKYVFNRDVVFSRILPMIIEKNKEDPLIGITSFDKYSNWMSGKKFGKKVLFPNGVVDKGIGDPIHITNAESITTHDNIEQNVIDVARNHPEVTFLYFIPPYSTKYWQEQVALGTIYKQIEAERMVIEEVLKYSNIELFSFNCMFEITTDLNNYQDSKHYGEWINSMILQCMKRKEYKLTLDNYNDYLEKELQYYTNYDYMQINDQVDYDNDVDVLKRIPYINS